jgi:osmotically-inducible protein OsmY
MKSDIELQRDVIAQLNWDPSIRNEDIAVAVKDGTVTLAGTIDSYAQWYAAERAVERLKDVRAIVNDLKVKLPGGRERSDPDIAHAALNALKWDVEVPDERIRVKVADGWITLQGEVEWHYQRSAAERAVSALTGVRGVSNDIIVRVTPAPGDVKQRIREMLKRQAEFDAENVTVELDEHTVRLRGTVRSFAEKRDAERAAWHTPGVTKVENDLIVNVPTAAGV